MLLLPVQHAFVASHEVDLADIRQEFCVVAVGATAGPGAEGDRPCPVQDVRRDEGTQCLALQETYLGPGSAGHYVKMVHNGIEYAMMQLIAESYHLLKSLYGLDNNALHEVYKNWNASELSGYLMDITADIFTVKDNEAHQYLVDLIKPVAEQKGTGMWTSESAMELQVPTSIINTAVEMRDLSLLTNEIQQAAKPHCIGGENPPKFSNS